MARKTKTTGTAASDKSEKNVEFDFTRVGIHVSMSRKLLPDFRRILQRRFDAEIEPAGLFGEYLAKLD